MADTDGEVVDLRLQGRFDFTYTEATRPPRRIQAVLTYLALANGKPVRRDVLAAMIWGDRADTQARQSLRQALSQLRKALGQTHAQALAQEEDAVLLDPKKLRVDALLIEVLASNQTRDTVMRAIRHYRGELLETIGPVTAEFDDWLEEERRRQFALIISGLSWLAEKDRPALQDRDVTALLDRLSRQDPASEVLAEIDIARLRDAGTNDLAEARYENAKRQALAEHGTEPQLSKPEPRPVFAEPQNQSKRQRKPLSKPRFKIMMSAFFIVVLAATVFAGRYFMGTGNRLDEGLSIGEFKSVDGGKQSRSLAQTLPQSLTSAIKMIGSVPLNETGGGRYVITGRIEEMTSGRYRILAQLEDRQSGDVLFTRVFERTIDTVRGDVFRKIVVATDVALGDGEQARYWETENLEAWLLASAAFEKMRSFSAAGLAEARALYREALETDPDFSRAKMGLALAHLFAIYVGQSPNDVVIETLIADITEADPAWPTVVLLRALRALSEGNYDDALKLSDEAQRLAPNAGDLLAAHGLILLQCGRVTDGKNFLDRTLEVQPEPAAWVYWMKARALRLSGNPAAALSILQQRGVPNSEAPLYLTEVILSGEQVRSAVEVETARQHLKKILPDFDARTWVSAIPNRNAEVSQKEVEILSR